MLEMIVEAIHDREELAFMYGCFIRIVEPYVVGASKTGNNVLWGFQKQDRNMACNYMVLDHVTHDHTMFGYEWDLFELSQISGLHPTGRHFIGERFGHQRGKTYMARIIAEL